MATSIFGLTSAEYSSKLYNEVLQQEPGHTDEDDLDLTPQSPACAANDTDDSSPPPPDLPTWDKIPINNLPDGTVPSFDYDLRPGPRVEGRNFFSTWLDQDETASYDPNNELDPYIRPPIDILERRRRRRRDRSDTDPDRRKRQKISTWQRGRIEGKRLPVTLSFATEQGRSALGSYGTALDNWPNYAWRPPTEDIDWDAWWNPGILLTDDEASIIAHEGHERRTKVAQDADEGSGPVDLADLVGHPVARGCKGCLDVGHRCPLLDEGSRYPCEICVQDGVDCELIREPKEKRACLNCGRKRICCSYRDEGSDHTRPCSNCGSQGLKCIAGPASGRTRTGPALGSTLPNKAGAITKKLVSCTQCRRAKRWCSRNKNKSAATCNECLKNGDICTFEPIKRTNARAKCISKLLAQPKPSYEPMIRPHFGGKMTQFIKTSLPHPIELNYVGDRPCHWCQDIGYGILGLGDAVDVEVVDFDDGSGYIELDGGYFGAGCEPSRMCDECTFERLAIAACLRHEAQDIKPIDGMGIDSFDFDCIYDYLMPGMATTAPFSWCSVCPNPAFFACCKQFNLGVTETDEIEDAEKQHGCGLRLCEACATCLIHESGGNLEALVHNIQERSGERLALRADVDLILPGGELVRRIGG